MKRSTGAVLNIVLAATIACIVPASAQENTPGVQGKWQNSGSTLNLSVAKGELEGRFTEVGTDAAGLGFKVGDVSLKVAQRGPFLVGEQTIRYASNPPCYRDGRKVPVIGRVTSDGQVLALHYYNVRVGPDCRDTGAYDITETLWQKATR